MKYFVVAVLFLSFLNADKMNQDILDIIEQDEEIIMHTEYEKVQDVELGKLLTPPKVEVQKQIIETVPSVIVPLSAQDIIVEKEIVVEKPKPQVRKTVPRSYKKESARRQMLRKAKYLQKKYEVALIKFENWEDKKELLKKTFHKKNGTKDVDFGEDNSYGKKRAQKRVRDYYRSLDLQERHIEERVDDAYVELTKIKDEFLFKYAVPITDEEMNGEQAPSIADKSQKVEMLNQYINENNAWRKCREKASEFDKISRVASSIEKVFPNSDLTKSKIAEHMAQNKAQMQSHVNRYQTIELEYRTKYGVAITSSERALAILNNINKN